MVNNRTSLVILFCMLVFFLLFLILGPPVLPDWKFYLLGVLLALFAGLFAFLLSGEIVTRVNANPSPKLQIRVQGTGGFGLTLVVLLWWLYGPIQSVSGAKKSLAEQLGNGQGATVQQGTVGQPTLNVQLSPTAMTLATNIIAADSNSSKLAPLATGKVSQPAFHAAMVSLIGKIEPATIQQGTNLQSIFGSGIGDIHFGMSPTEVNAVLSNHFGSSDWKSLPIAGEYGPLDVRYFWIYVNQWSPAPPTGLSMFQPCWSGNSYVTFLFNSQGLMRISIRFLSDCGQRTAMFSSLAKELNVTNYNGNGPIGFSVSLLSTTVASYVGPDISSLELSINGSPEPK